MALASILILSRGHGYLIFFLNVLSDILMCIPDRNILLTSISASCFFDVGLTEQFDFD